jgi:hypothetical protein
MPLQKGALQPGSKSERIVTYFKEHYLGKVDDPLQVREEMVKALGFKNHDFYGQMNRMRQLIKSYKSARSLSTGSANPTEEMSPAPGPRSGGVVEIPETTVFDIPSDIGPDAKKAFSKLLNFISEQSVTIQAKDVEIYSLRGQLTQQNSRMRLLKKIGGELIEAL